MDLTPEIKDKAAFWTTDLFDAETRETVADWLANNPQEVVESFYKDLDFGTGGMRGIMSVGTNRINKYTLGMATQGLANYLKAQFPGEENHKVAIAHDSRNFSREFSEGVAEVLSGNNISVYLFESLRPTPELSYAVRKLNCQAGIVLTASHNPKEYNGYKVYWSDGGQLVPPHDKGVIQEVRKVVLEDVIFEGKPEIIHSVGADIDNPYVEDIANLSLSDEGKKDLKIVFTALHGTSITLLPPALEKMGFTQVDILESQATPDGNFPTVISPNPEEAEALKLAVERADETGADLVIGTDPDSDRVGIAVRGEDGKMHQLNGNQTASLLVEYVLRKNAEAGNFKGNEFIAETVVTTDLLEKIGTAHGVQTKKCLTGFKWIAKLIRETEGQEKFLVGGEESYGYLVGDFVRDKDAIASAVMIAEVAAEAKAKGSTMLSELKRIHCQYGHYQEALVSMTKKGISGSQEIAKMMEDLRVNPPSQLGGETVTHVMDYNSLTTTEIASGATKSIDLPATNMIQLLTEGGAKITARPSGTEPKIKFYISVNEACTDDQYEASREKLLQQIQTIKSEMNI